MLDLSGNHIVGFPTTPLKFKKMLKYCYIIVESYQSEQRSLKRAFGYSLGKSNVRGHCFEAQKTFFFFFFLSVVVKFTKWFHEKVFTIISRTIVLTRATTLTTLLTEFYRMV